MPQGLDGLMSQEELTDLLAFLSSLRGSTRRVQFHLLPFIEQQNLSTT
jgi:hypothetical protein